MKRIRKAGALLLLPMVMLLTMNLGTCNDPYGVAAKAAQDVAVIDNKGAQTIHSLFTSGLITAKEQTEALGWTGAIATMNDTYIGCVKNAHSQSTKAAGLAACAQTFSASLQNPTFLNSVHITNLNSQNTVIAIAGAASDAISAVIIAEQNFVAKGK